MQKHRPKLIGLSIDDQRRGVRFAIHVLNKLRNASNGLFNHYLAPGARQDARPDVDDVSRLLDEFKELHEVLAADRAEAAAYGQIATMIESGGQFCQQLLGVDNRVGLLAEINELNLYSISLDTLAYSRQMQDITSHALDLVKRGEEMFSELINEALCDPTYEISSLPSLTEVACQAIVNAVSEVASAACNPLESRDDLNEALHSNAEQVNIITGLLDKVTDQTVRAMAEALPLYQKWAESVITDDSAKFRARLNKIGVVDCVRHAHFIQNNETDERLKERVVNDILDHFHFQGPHKSLLFEWYFRSDGLDGLHFHPEDMKKIAAKLKLSVQQVYAVYEQLLDLLSGMGD